MERTVRAWVVQADEAALRTTQDVDILVAAEARCRSSCE